MNLNKPVVGVVCDVIKYGANGFHGVGEKYINAIAHRANAIPILIPAQVAGEDLESLQQLNVALGGELYQCLHQHEQFIEHRENKQGTRDEQYQPAHQVTLAEDGLVAEAYAPDG
ncbi:hypothetical protein A9Q98_16025 [Thalassotalea sp. 42_200_T64]|nr:hypothetical protein A9Q98_16025 [Thalassotalea sp. 42_200_T64]